MILSYSQLQLLPKVEFHRHLEGSIAFETLINWYHRNGSSTMTIDQLKSQMQFPDFKSFIMKWIQNLSLIQTENDYADMLKGAVDDCVKDHIRHVEFFYSPFDFNGRLDPVEITKTLIQTAADLMKKNPITIQLIADIVRNHPYETAIDRIKVLMPFRGEFLVGIGLGGSEHQFPNELFVPAFQFASSVGFRTVAHAGEAAGAESVLTAIQHLHVERIGHGIRCVESREVLDVVIHSQIPLEVCPTSNVSLKIVDDFKSHPIKKLIQEGVNVTLHTDDPSYFLCTLTDEYFRMVTEFGCGLDEIVAIAERGINASFASQIRKSELKRDLDEWKLSLKDSL